MPLDPASTVGQLIVEHPARSRVLERFGIDYCCGGRKTLAQACRDKGHPVEAVIEEIEAADRSEQGAGSEPNPASMSTTELCGHIESTHHAWLRRELPRLAMLVRKVADAHGDRDERLRELVATFESFAGDLFSHMQKEEQVLFPALRLLDRGELTPGGGSLVGDSVSVMIQEHDEAGQALAAMRDLTDGFAVPAGACNTHRAMLDALRTLEADMHQHVHKENNVLFPRVRVAAGIGAEGRDS